MMAHDGLSENGMPKNVMVDDHFPHKNGNEFGISSIFGHTQMFTISPIIFWVYPPTLSTRLYTTDRPAATHLFGFVHIGEAALAILLHPRRRVGKKEPCLLLGNDDKSLDLGTMGYLLKKKTMPDWQSTFNGFPLTKKPWKPRYVHQHFEDGLPKSSLWKLFQVHEINGMFTSLGFFFAPFAMTGMPLFWNRPQVFQMWFFFYFRNN